MDMKRKFKMGRRLLVMFIMGILLGSVCSQAMGMAARAEEDGFSIDAQMQPSDESTYDICLTIENRAGDWEGTVRISTVTSYRTNDNTVYDTALALPQGSKKQFTVRIPKDSIEQTDGLVQVTLLDNKNSKVIAQKDFNRLLQGGADALAMGILSDEYSALTYLDMGGREVYCNGSSYPIKLMELNQDNVMDSLGVLDILVIDSYDTGILTDETAAGIEDWNNKGGALLIGTGSQTKTLDAFDYLDMQAQAVDGYPSASELYDTDAYIDISQLHMAKLKDIKDIYYTAYGTIARICSQGDGAVGILPYALSELGRLDSSFYQEGYEQEELVKGLLEEVISIVGVHYGKQGAGYYGTNAGNDKYVFESLFELFGNGSSSLHFGGLKVIVVIYVVFVGPVLYLILHFVKKRDFYWWTVPVAALAGILLIYWTGRGFEVVDTRVYSMTLENLSGEGDAVTFLHCYDADHKKWSMELAREYEYAGISIDNYYGDRNPYYYIRQEGDRLLVGADPVTSFEDCYFQAGGAIATGSGSILGDFQKKGWDITGTVANNTNCDFAYFAVIKDGVMYLYKNLPKGEVCDLSSAKVLYTTDSSYDSVVRSYLYDHMREVCRSDDRSELDALAALGMGVAAAYPEGADKTMIIGVAKDWQKAVDDNCSETAYGCLYTIQ